MALTITGLLLLGLALLVVEVFIPGMVVGIAGALALMAAVVLGFVHYGFETGTWLLAGVLAGSVAFFIWWIRYIPRSTVGRRWTLEAEVPPGLPKGGGVERVGAIGHALTTLRPAGAASLDGRRVDVLAESGVIDAGEPVEVVRVDGKRTVVRRQLRQESSAALEPATAL